MTDLEQIRDLLSRANLDGETWEELENGQTVLCYLRYRSAHTVCFYFDDAGKLAYLLDAP